MQVPKHVTHFVMWTIFPCEGSRIKPHSSDGNKARVSAKSDNHCCRINQQGY